MCFAKLKRELESRYPGAVLEETDGCAFHLTAPPRHTWDGDLHEFVSEHRASLAWPRNAKDVKAALDDLRSRVQEPVVCTDENCDWCNDNEE